MSPVSHGLQESGKGRAHTARMWEAAWLKRIRMGCAVVVPGAAVMLLSGPTAIVAAVIVIPALLFIAVTAGLMTVAKNHISQGANEPTNSYGNASPSDPNQADPEPTSTVYRMDERPGYESMVTYVTDKLDHYKDEILNNNTMFMSEYRIPDTQDGTDYMTGYMAALLGTVNEAKAAANETSEDPDALDAKIDSYRTTVDTLEARFKKGRRSAFR